jgi:hypothetical protein
LWGFAAALANPSGRPFFHNPMKNTKSKFQAAARFLMENGETVMTVIIFAISFARALAEAESKPRQRK